MFRSFDFDDPSGQLASTAGTEQYTYDAAGNRLSLRRRDGRTLTFTYDNLNRMTSKLIPDGCPPIQPPGTGCPPASATRDVYYRYDLLGRQTHAIFDSQSGADRVTNVYDGFGNIAYSVTAIGGLSRQVCSASSPCLYDADNNRTQVRVEGQTVTYAYDARSRLTGVYEGAGTASPLATFAYNADDTLGSRSEGAGGGGSASYGYDAIGRLASQSDAFPAWSASNAGWTFALNPASQIASETRTNDAYAFPVGASSKSYAVNGLNQYTSVAATPYTYDASGNLTGDGTNAHVYDGENRLVSATAAGVTAALTYDPLGRLWRVQKGTADTRFLYDGDALVTEYDATGAVTARYVHGSNAAADDPLVWYLGSGIAAKRYFHPDRLGSIVTATNGASAPTINTYDEYGVPKAANVGRFQYTGQAWLPELGLYYYKARMYSPTLGRFLQVDPIGYGDQLNLYAYAADNPVNLSDSTGLANTCSRVDSTACSGDYEGSLGPGTGGSGLGVYRVTETSTYSSPAGPFSLSTSWLEIRGVSAALQFATPGNPLFRNATFRRAYTGGPDAASTSWWDAYALIDPGYHYLDTNIVLVLSGQYPGDRATVPARQYGLIGGKNDFYQRYTLIGPIYQKPAPLVLNGPRIFFSPTAHALYFAPFHGNPGPGVPTGFIRIRPDAR